MSSRVKQMSLDRCTASSPPPATLSHALGVQHGHSVPTTARVTPLDGSSRRAAQYIRMSTEQQTYSPARQREAIETYAQQHGYAIVATYEDDGRSGLSIQGRSGLIALLDDIANGHAGYEAILVYDVSRWGRFQDTDESAYYEFVCRRAGIRVEYCVEAFCNDGTPMAAVVKALKRIMAGEYSRELSHKVVTSKRRMAEMGFWMGGRTGYGFRRLLVDADGNPKLVLEAGQRKSIQSEHIKLCLGPESEQKTVRWMYRQVATKGLGYNQIARLLNTRRVPCTGGTNWNYQRVKNILTSVQYTGVFYFGQSTARLSAPQVPAPRESWLRIDWPHLRIVTDALYERVQHVLTSTSREMSNQTGLELLRALYAKRGRLSTHMIDRAPGVPTADWYRARFGSLRKAYDLVGYYVPGDEGHWEGFGARIALAKILRATVTEQLRGLGATVDRHGQRLLVVNGRLTLLPMVGRYVPIDGRLRCQVRTGGKSDWVLINTVEAGTHQPLKYYLVPGCRWIHTFSAPDTGHPERVASDSLEPLIRIVADLPGPPSPAPA